MGARADEGVDCVPGWHAAEETVRDGQREKRNVIPEYCDCSCTLSKPCAPRRNATTPSASSSWSEDLSNIRPSPTHLTQPRFPNSLYNYKHCISALLSFENLHLILANFREHSRCHERRRYSVLKNHPESDPLRGLAVRSRL